MSNESERYNANNFGLGEEQILGAIERGEFDNLPGMGKPLRLEHDRLVPEEYRLAYRIMRDNDVLPEWIGLQKEIDGLWEEANNRLQSAAQNYHRAWARAEHQTGVAGVTARLTLKDNRADAQARFRDQVQHINKKIQALNLKVPASHITRDLINPDHEIKKAFPN